MKPLIRLNFIAFFLLVTHISCTQKPNEEFPLADLETAPNLEMLISDFKALDTLKDERIQLAEKNHYKVEQLIAYEQHIMVHSIRSYRPKTVHTFLKEKNAEHTKLLYYQEEFSVEIPHNDFQSVFSWLMNKLDTTEVMGRLVHQVFPDSVPTTAWEQLIHDGNSEVTVVVKTNEKQEISSVFFDVNPHQQTNTLSISRVGDGVVINWEMADSITQ